jgi:hypothetical protein
LKTSIIIGDNLALNNLHADGNCNVPGDMLDILTVDTAFDFDCVSILTLIETVATESNDDLISGHGRPLADDSGILYQNC